MTRFHLTITIFNPFFSWKLNARWKIDSVWFYDYSILFNKILQGMSYKEINKFRLNLFEWYKHNLSCVRVSQFIDWNVVDWFSIVSQDFNVSSHIIACCLPNRKLRDEYFDYDCMRERYYVKPDFILYLK